jgi:hypothetical protein
MSEWISGDIKEESKETLPSPEDEELDKFTLSVLKDSSRTSIASQVTDLTTKAASVLALLIADPFMSDAYRSHKKDLYA